MASSLRRQNFDVDPDQAAILEAVRVSLHASTIKESILRSARMVNAIAGALAGGKRLVVVDEKGETTRIVLPDLESALGWNYLCERPHPWRRQLWVKGLRLLASTLWLDFSSEGMTPEEIAEDRSLPIEAVREAIRYSEANLPLIQMEAAEERRRLIASGVELGS